MQFDNAIEYLNTLINYEQLPSQADLRERRLERMETLLHALGDPQRTFQSIHIAGTKGKGSVAAFVYAILARCGVPVGLYTSPHLMSARDRIRVTPHEGASDWISEEAFTDGVARVRDAIAHTTMTGGPVTYFEAMTALACDHFARRRVLWAVMEVGLGGRLDATNVVPSPMAILTPISLDHTEVLGDSLTDIAREKSGVIKPEQIVISATQSPDAQDVIAQRCAAVEARLVMQARDFSVECESIRQDGSMCHVMGHAADYPDIYVPLLGRHQVDNAAVAIAALEAIATRHPELPITLTTLREGIARVAWPGRGELIPTTPPVLLDGAHNRASAMALRQLLTDLFPQQRIGLVVGMSQGKDVEGFIDALQPVVDAVWATQADHPRAISAQQLAARAQHIAPAIQPMAHPGEAIHRAQAAGCDLIVLTGSLYLIGEVRRHVAALAG